MFRIAQMVDPGILAAKFEQTFSVAPQIYRAPGRVNLIGEHTDYNEGFVLPAAIDFSCYAAASARSDSRFVLFSENLQETITVPLAAFGLPVVGIRSGSYSQFSEHRELQHDGRA